MRMTLSDYLADQSLTDAEFASRVGVSQSTINRAKRGLLDLRVEVALAIETATGGAVDAATLSSDVRKVREAGGLMPHAADICTADAALSGGKVAEFAPLLSETPQGADVLTATSLAGAEADPSVPAAFSGEGAGGVIHGGAA